MSKFIATAVIRGSHQVVDEAEKLLKKAIAEKGKDLKFEFPDTAFYLPFYYVIYSHHSFVSKQNQEAYRGRSLF